MKIINTSTKLIGLIGMPLSQSLSPLLHNEAYDSMGIDYFYLPLELSRGEKLPELLAGLRLMNFAGLAVTKPYKVEILQYLDNIDPVAAMIGSCNTICIENQVWTGYNTDGLGALRSLREEMGRDMQGLSFVSFGAGGAARSTCFELAKAGAGKILLIDINENALILAAELNKHFPGLAEGILATNSACKSLVAEADVLLNMSGLGMQPHLEATPLPKDWINPRHICFDAVYAPAKTRFLQEAEEQGCQIINGLGMCVYQGVEQIKLWTGREDGEKYLRGF